MHENLKGYVNTFAYIYAIIFNTIKNTQDRYLHKLHSEGHNSFFFFFCHTSTLKLQSTNPLLRQILYIISCTLIRQRPNTPYRKAVNIHSSLSSTSLSAFLHHHHQHSRYVISPFPLLVFCSCKNCWPFHLKQQFHPK